MTGAKEPLMHIVKRDGVSLGRAMLVRLVALVFALLVCAAIIFGLTGMNPLNVYAGIWDGAVGTNRRHVGHLPRRGDFAVRGLCGAARFPHAVLECGRGGTGAGGRHGFCRHYDLWKEPASWAMYALCPVAGVAAG